MNEPIKNSVDDEFIEKLNHYIKNETISSLIQSYIKKIVEHEVDVITDSDWFEEKLNEVNS